VPAPVAAGYVYPNGLTDPEVGSDGGHHVRSVETAMGTAGALYGSA
jgi:hypothetical protein